MKQWTGALLCLLCFLTATAQKKWPEVKVLTRGTATSLRGLSVVTDRIIWVSGSNGTIGRSTDGGETWNWTVVKGFEKRDFRDIEAFDATSAIIIAVDTPAYILKTVDGGASWKVVYENRKPGMFLDALEFWNDQSGIVIGDPIGRKVFVARTFDGGSTWQELSEQSRPATDSGEAFFAASGTNVRVLDKDEAVMVSGGLRSRLFIRNEVRDLPILQGSESTGANSVAVLDAGRHRGGTTLMVVGGDFSNPGSDSSNCFYSRDRGRTWKAPKRPPHGYRSAVEYLSKKQVICSGITGVDFSFDGGQNWRLISKEGFHTCRIARRGSAVFLTGGKGIIGKIEYPK